MDDLAIATNATRDNPLLAVVAGGLTAGAIDIGYAIVASSQRGVAPSSVLQSVASGLLGRAAYKGGTAAALLGGLLHFAMTIAMAAIFVFAFRRFEIVRHNFVIAGLLYGTAIYFVMRWVIVPLSRFPGAGMKVVHLTELTVHAIGVGLVMALCARRFAGQLPN